MNSVVSFVYVVIVLQSYVSSQRDPNWWSNRDAIVHLFEWPFKDIAAECERFLAPKGYAGVQVKYTILFRNIFFSFSLYMKT